MKKKLTDLRPQWIGYARPNSGEGITFDCPVCPSHRLAAYFRNPRDGQEMAPGLAKWERDGSEFETLTIHPSIDYPCFHGWVEHGLVFDVMESPLVVFGPQGPGKMGPIALSPRQARVQAEIILRETAEFFGEALPKASRTE